MDGSSVCAGARRAARLALSMVVVALAIASGCGGPAGGGAAPTLAAGDAALARDFAGHASGVEAEGAGTVIRLLPDDQQGGRHQRFILRLHSGQTLLIAHNIDVAPRVTDIRVGDRVAFRGVYEWNAQGGVVHWTHHDPSGAHPAGWLRHDGRTVE